MAHKLCYLRHIISKFPTADVHKTKSIKTFMVCFICNKSGGTLSAGQVLCRQERTALRQMAHKMTHVAAACTDDKYSEDFRTTLKKLLIETANL